MEELGNRVVLVTGGSAGIGRKTVAELAARGARVVTCARHGDRLDEALSDLAGVTGLVADVADPERVAVQIADCLSSPRSRTVAVPRWAGLARLGEVPPLNRLVDRVLSGRAGGLRRLAGSSVQKRTG